MTCTFFFSREKLTEEPEQRLTRDTSPFLAVSITGYRPLISPLASLLKQSDHTTLTRCAPSIQELIIFMYFNERQFISEVGLRTLAMSWRLFRSISSWWRIGFVMGSAKQQVGKHGTKVMCRISRSMSYYAVDTNRYSIAGILIRREKVLLYLMRFVIKKM